MRETNLQFDREHIWHPYTSTIEPLSVYHVESAEGCTITLSDGRKLIDGMSSWWSAIHGYNNATLNNAASKQLEKMSHIMFGGFTHSPAIELSKLLVDITPDELQWVFLADSGSVSVEVAMKIAMQYWQNRGESQKKEFAALRGGYHGDTIGAMSICDPITGMHSLFKGLIKENLFLERPTSLYGEKLNTTDRESLQDFFETNHKRLAAFVLEPIVQGAGGMHFYSVAFLQEVRRLCTEYNILLIADEIATGLGRTGELFACTAAKITPDIMCVGKALTGGYMTLAATLATKNVADQVSANGNVMMHGPTFMGNPLACAVAVASIRLLLKSPWQTRVQAIESHFRRELFELIAHDKIAEVRVLGAIGVVELHEPVEMKTIQPLFVENGIWIRPFGKLVYLMPPFVITSDELQTLTDQFKKTILEYLNV